jgi:putative restriction endonuclease
MNIDKKIELLKSKLNFWENYIPVNNMGKWGRSVAIESYTKKISNLENEIKNTLKPEYKRAERTILTSSRLKRNISLSETVKNLYEFKCQICDVHLQTPKGAIAIGAHIKGLGSPHHGPDVLENMLCLCPNHHEQFDKFGYYIDPETFEVKQLKGFEGKKIKIVTKHEIDKSFLIYHMENFRSRNTA